MRCEHAYMQRRSTIAPSRRHLSLRKEPFSSGDVPSGVCVRDCALSGLSFQAAADRSDSTIWKETELYI